MCGVDLSAFKNGGLRCVQYCYVLFMYAQCPFVAYWCLLEVCVSALLRLSSSPIACLGWKAQIRSDQSSESALKLEPRNLRVVTGGFPTLELINSEKIFSMNPWNITFSMIWCRKVEKTWSGNCRAPKRSTWTQPLQSIAIHCNPLQSIACHCMPLPSPWESLAVPGSVTGSPFEAVWAPEHGTSAPGETESCWCDSRKMWKSKRVHESHWDALRYIEIHWVNISWRNPWNWWNWISQIQVCRPAIELAQPTACGANKFFWDGLGFGSGWALQAQRFQLVPKPEPLAASCCVLPTVEALQITKHNKTQCCLLSGGTNILHLYVAVALSRRFLKGWCTCGQLMMLPFQDSGQVVHI